jgi:NhaP-type Na+/H+ or K+/H+ antiporter
MRIAYVGLSLALALFIISQAVSKPVFFSALIIPVIVFLYGLTAKEMPFVPKVDDDDEEIADPKNE